MKQIIVRRVEEVEVTLTLGVEVIEGLPVVDESSAKETLEFLEGVKSPRLRTRDSITFTETETEL